MLSKFSCKITYLDSESLEYKVMADDVTYEVWDKYISIESWKSHQKKISSLFVSEFTSILKSYL